MYSVEKQVITSYVYKRNTIVPEIREDISSSGNDHQSTQDTFTDWSDFTSPFTLQNLNIT